MLKYLLLRHQITLALLSLLLVGFLLYTFRSANNPPGFFIDESSVAYNAHLIAQTGHDEFGTHWPLYFRAFGDYKNPVYIYLLAALFRLTGPHIGAARALSAVAGVLTALLLGLLATHVARDRRVGIVMIGMTLLTPWLFELSRVVMEVDLYPLVLVLFLLAMRHAFEKGNWGWLEALGIAASLALVTYTYSIGRLLAPLLAAGLVLFMTRTRGRWLLATWILYALSLVPLLVFQKRYPEALTARFHAITYLPKQNTFVEIAGQFIRHFAANINPWRLFGNENSRVSEIIHIPGAPPMLLATGVLIVISIFVLVRKHGFDAWWSFIVYGVVVAVVPASLTNEHFHMLRLAPLPVFLVVLAIPGIAWLVERIDHSRRFIPGAILLLLIGQGLFFIYQYHNHGYTAQRLHLFDADYPARLLPTALAVKQNPVYICDASAVPGYIQALWYGTLQNIPRERFVVLPPAESPPQNSVVITTEDLGPWPKTLAASEPYTVYIATDAPRALSPVPEGQFRADINVPNSPQRLQRGEQITIDVDVRNASEVVWLAPQRELSPFRLSVGNHWLGSQGELVVHDDGRGLLRRALLPGESVQIPLTINAPTRPGDYLLEIDMLQEGVAWFADKGSHSWRGRITVIN